MGCDGKLYLFEKEGGGHTKGRGGEEGEEIPTNCSYLKGHKSFSIVSVSLVGVTDLVANVRERYPVLVKLIGLLLSLTKVRGQLANSTETNCFNRSRYWLNNSTLLWPAPSTHNGSTGF